ncbi:unnamed protein product [Caenorhabditis bovis]|uniref:Uncharacterized protein n=1 Tax=Caenorhabditis bovis TaxID=2654633 RepID=A0A8S1FBV8_9PELO|nr:unnamed protein product [Caenorhabditis bovis]
MLGMMNSPSNDVEFYATNRKLSDEIVGTSTDVASSDLQTFSGVKPKDKVTYTPDGRKMINEKIVEVSDASTLWKNTLLFGRIRSTFEKSKKDPNVSISEHADVVEAPPSN